MLRWLILLFALVEGGWLAFDGAHGLITGDYVTPSSGEYAGQLGPWSKLVSAVGIEPRSTFFMGVHLALGVAWLVSIAGFLVRRPWSWRAMLACAVAGLWYLPFGTLLSALQIFMLSRRSVRSSSRPRRD